VDGQVVDAVDVYVGGRSGPDPKLAVKVLEDVPCDKLSLVLEGLVPYHTRDRMHRVRGGAAKTSTTMNQPSDAGSPQTAVRLMRPVLSPA